MGSYTDYTVRPIDLTKKQGESVEGILIGSREIDGKYGRQTIWKFRELNDGMFFEIYNFTNLGRTLESVPAGTQLKMTYTGKSKDEVDTVVGKARVHEVKIEVFTPSSEEEKEALLKKHFDAEPLGGPEPATSTPAISKQAEKLGQHSTLYYDLLKQVESRTTKQSYDKLVEDTLTPRASELTPDDRTALNKRCTEKVVELAEREKREDLPF